MAKKSSPKPMTTEAARRIQAHADATNTNQGFKGRAARAAKGNQGGKTAPKSSGNKG